MAGLILLSRSWRETGREPPTNGTYLLVEVKIICTSGHWATTHTISRRLTTPVSCSMWRRPVSRVGHWASASFRGPDHAWILAFDIPRGDVTLLMSDDSDQSITALKIPD